MSFPFGAMNCPTSAICMADMHSSDLIWPAVVCMMLLFRISPFPSMYNATPEIKQKINGYPFQDRVIQVIPDTVISTVALPV